MRMSGQNHQLITFTLVISQLRGCNKILCSKLSLSFSFPLAVYFESLTVWCSLVLSNLIWIIISLYESLTPETANKNKMVKLHCFWICKSTNFESKTEIIQSKYKQSLFANYVIFRLKFFPTDHQNQRRFHA